MLDFLSLIRVFALSLGLSIFLFGLNILNRWRHRRIPGPKPQWLLGNGGTSSNQMGLPGKGHLAHQRWARAYGGIYVVFMGRQPQVVLTDPDLIKEAGVKGFRALHDRPQGPLQAGTKADQPLMDRGIFTGKGKFWSGLRAACDPLFHREALVGYAPPMNKAIDGLLRRLDAASKGGVTVNMPHALAQMTMDVIGSTTFGVDFHAQEGGGHSKPLLEAAGSFFQPFEPISFAIMSMTAGIPGLREVLLWLAFKLRQPRICETCRGRALLWGATQQLLSNALSKAGVGAGADADVHAGAVGYPSKADTHSSVTDGKMGTSRSGPNPYAGAAANSKLEEEQREEFEKGRQLYQGATPSGTSIIKLLSKGKNAENGRPLEDVEVCSTMMTFLLAGYETTSLALSYALYELAKQPELQDRIAREVGGLGLPLGAPLDFAHLSRLPLTEACFNEAMRMYPPAPSFVVLAREAREPVTVGGYTIPRGSHVVFNTWALHHDPRHFSQPEEFRPERFLPGSAEAAKRHPFAYLPFGVGPRKCIGYKFAMEEGVLALARLLQRFEFEVDPQHHPPGSALDLTLGITLTCRGGIWLRARRRPGWEGPREE